MSSPSNQTSTGDDEGEDFPIAAIICIAVGGYVVIIIAIIVIKHMLTSHGMCKSDCCQRVEDGTRQPCCCSICAKVGDCCTCCGGCHVNGCLTSICGKPKRTNCIDILLCNCGGCTERCCTGCHCSCGCGCLKNIKSCTCCQGVCLSCSCQNCCSNFCVDISHSGACGCLCLEVKLRSPRSGSMRRSHSAPPGKGDDVKRFNTHFPPIKDGEGHILFQEIGGGDFAKLKEASDISASDLKFRSTSLSRSKTAGSISLTANEHVSKKVSKNVVSSSTATPRVSDRCGEIIRKDSRGSSMNSKSNDFRQNNRRSNRSMNIVNNNNENKLNANVRTSRHRSLRVGNQSQRFPQKFLVSSESVDSGIDSSRFPSDSGDKKSHSMPRQTIISKRPLPSLKNVSHPTKLSKTS